MEAFDGAALTLRRYLIFLLFFLFLEVHIFLKGYTYRLFVNDGRDFLAGLNIDFL